MTTLKIDEYSANAFFPIALIPRLTDEQGRMADRLKSWDIEFALERLVWEKKLKLVLGSTVEREFKRFMFLIGMGVRPIAMISPKIDELWHQMVLFTRRYEAFCLETVGFFVHHTPETTEQPIPVQAAVNLMLSYERVFGPLPPIWFLGLTQEVKKQYQVRPFEKKPPVRWSGWTGEDGPAIATVMPPAGSRALFDSHNGMVGTLAR